MSRSLSGAFPPVCRGALLVFFLLTPNSYRLFRVRRWLSDKIAVLRTSTWAKKKGPRGPFSLVCGGLAASEGLPRFDLADPSRIDIIVGGDPVQVFASLDAPLDFHSIFKGELGARFSIIKSHERTPFGAEAGLTRYRKHGYRTLIQSI